MSKLSAFRKKVTFLIIGFVIIYTFYLRWEWLIENVYFLNVMYSFIYDNFVQMTLGGMFLSSLFGGIFIIFLPIEFQFAYYFSSHHHLLLVIAVLLVGNIIGLSIDYFIGKLFGERLARKLLKKRYDKFVGIMQGKFGSFLIFFGNIIIFPIELFSVAVGSAKYPYKKFLLYTFLGKLIKFAVMVYLMIVFGLSLDMAFLLSLI